MDKPLKLRIFRDIANFEAQVIGNVLELQRDQVKLVTARSTVLDTRGPASVSSLE